MFREAQLIGLILGKCQLGISDGWIAMRIERMVEKGEPAAVTAAPADGPAYHRVLRKIKTGIGAIT